MCPACMTSAVLLATGATSAGGLIGLFAVKLRNRERRQPTRRVQPRSSEAASKQIVVAE
jgi:hypothetical protein